MRLKLAAHCSLRVRLIGTYVLAVSAAINRLTAGSAHASEFAAS